MQFRDSKLYLTFNDVSLVPRRSSVRSRSLVDLASGRLGLEVPLISANMDTVTGSDMAAAMYRAGGMGVLHRFSPLKSIVDSIKRLKGEGVALFGASIGVGPEDIEWAHVYAELGVPVLCIDVAHGHHNLVLELLEELSLKVGERFQEIIAGNVCTCEAAVELATAGATIIKVGVGPGTMCTTRIVTGHGVPQLSAIAECVEALGKLPADSRPEVIADGGVRNSGDIAKALAAGANYVMSGRLFAGCDETPAPVEIVDGKRCKVYRGSASHEAQSARGNKGTIIVEGVARRVPAKGPVASVLDETVGGLRSAFSYCGASNIQEFQGNARFIRVSGNAFQEGKPEV